MFQNTDATTKILSSKIFEYFYTYGGCYFRRTFFEKFINIAIHQKPEMSQNCIKVIINNPSIFSNITKYYSGLELLYILAKSEKNADTISKKHDSSPNNEFILTLDKHFQTYHPRSVELRIFKNVLPKKSFKDTFFNAYAKYVKGDPLYYEKEAMRNIGFTGATLYY